jgi:hypothetical protein
MSDLTHRAYGKIEGDSRCCSKNYFSNPNAQFLYNLE